MCILVLFTFFIQHCSLASGFCTASVLYLLLGCSPVCLCRVHAGIWQSLVGKTNSSGVLAGEHLKIKNRPPNLLLSLFPRMCFSYRRLDAVSPRKHGNNHICWRSAKIGGGCLRFSLWNRAGAPRHPSTENSTFDNGRKKKYATISSHCRYAEPPVLLFPAGNGVLALKKLWHFGRRACVASVCATP